MPKPELVATIDQTYMTRRLKAGDKFPARNKTEARILVDVLGKATYGTSGLKAPVIEQAPVPTIEEVLEAKVIEAEPRKRRRRKAKAKK